MATITLHGHDFELDAEDLVPLTEIWRRAGKPRGKEPWRFKDLARTKRWLETVKWKGVRGKGTWVGQSLLITWYIEWLGLEYKPADAKPESEKFDADAWWAEVKARAQERAKERMAKQEAEEAARKQAEPEPEPKPEPEPTYQGGEDWEYRGESWKGEYDPDTAGEEWKGEPEREPEPDEPAYMPPGAHVNLANEGYGPHYLFMDFLEIPGRITIRASVN